MKLIKKYEQYISEELDTSDGVEVSKRETLKKIDLLNREGYFNRFEMSNLEWDKYINQGVKNLVKISQYKKDLISKKIKEIDKSNIFWFGSTHYYILLNSDINYGTSQTEVRIVISEIEDEWFIAKFGFSHFTYTFKCDQIDGVLSFIMSLYEIIKEFSIGRTVKKY